MKFYLTKTREVRKKAQEYPSAFPSGRSVGAPSTQPDACSRKQEAQKQWPLSPALPLSSISLQLRLWERQLRKSLLIGKVSTKADVKEEVIHR